LIALADGVDLLTPFSDVEAETTMADGEEGAPSCELSELDTKTTQERFIKRELKDQLIQRVRSTKSYRKSLRWSFMDSRYVAGAVLVRTPGLRRYGAGSCVGSSRRTLVRGPLHPGNFTKAVERLDENSICIQTWSLNSENRLGLSRYDTIRRAARRA